MDTPRIAGERASIVTSGAGDMLNVMGTRNEVKLRGTQGGGKLSVFETTAGPGDGVPMHTHSREDEYFYVLEGEVEFDDAGTRTVGGPGTFVMLPVHRPHAWRVAGDRPARMLIMTTPGTFDAFFAELACPPGQQRPMEQVIAICARFGIEFHLPN